LRTDQHNQETPCDATRAWTQRFVGGASDAAQNAAAREHLDDCRPCADEYHTAVETAAQIGRQRRLERGEVERSARHLRLRKAAFDAQGPRPGRLHRLRTLLYPAFFAFLILQLVGGRPIEGLGSGRVQAGEAHVGNATLRPVEGTFTLGEGEWCRSSPEASVELEFGSTRIALDGAARMRVQKLRPLALYLANGSVTIEGTCGVTCRAGVFDVQVGSSVDLRLDETRLEVVVRAGRVDLIDASGGRRIEAGERLLIGEPLQQTKE